MKNLEPISPQGLAEPLTKREREILSLLAQDHTAPEIAARLTIALSSVKWHMLHIYGKLGVNRRQHALRRAAELGLLASPPAALTTPARDAAPPEGRAGPWLTTTPARQHNLPFALTNFFGREAEIAQLTALLAERRLITLSGPGGVGKTRLSLQVAERALGDFSAGVWLVELAALSDPALVAQSVAVALGVRDESGRPIEEILTAWLTPRQLLLVLDNCEHLLDECARLADRWLRASGQLRILATSREPLGMAGEAVYAVQSLPYPDPEAMPPFDRLSDYAALTLLVDRARLVVTDYQVAPRQAPALARICQRLNGIPLAIELAAARLNILTAAELADRLDDAFSLLTSGNRSALPRQQTLRAMLDWSYRLLSADQRRLLQRLSVFAGGWTLLAAESVCSGHGLEAGAVLGVLTALVAKSIVIAERRQGVDTRFYLLETVRQYAQEKLQAAGQAAPFQRRHRDFFEALAESSTAQLDTTDRPLWNRRLPVELDNFRQALDWSFKDDGDIEAGPRLVMLLTKRSFECHSYQEQLDWHLRALAHCESRPGISAELQVHLLERASGLVGLNDPEAAFELSRRAIEIGRRLGPEGQETLMWTLYNMAWDFAGHVRQSDQILGPLAEAEAILQALGPEHYSPETWLKHQAGFASLRAEIALFQGRYADAKVQAAEGLRLLEAGGGLWNQAEPRTRLGIACFYLGEYQAARDHLLIALDLNRVVHAWEEPYNLRWLAATDIATGNLERAFDYCLECIQLANAMPDRNFIASSLGLLAVISAQRGQANRAARLAGASAALWARQKRQPWEDSSLDTLLPGWCDGPDIAVISQSYAAGQALSSVAAVAYALGEQAETA